MNLAGSQFVMISIYATSILLISLLFMLHRRRRVAASSEQALSGSLIGFTGQALRRNVLIQREELKLEEKISSEDVPGDALEGTPTESTHSRELESSAPESDSKERLDPITPSLSPATEVIIQGILPAAEQDTAENNAIVLRSTLSAPVEEIAPHFAVDNKFAPADSRFAQGSAEAEPIAPLEEGELGRTAAALVEDHAGVEQNTAIAEGKAERISMPLIQEGAGLEQIAALPATDDGAPDSSPPIARETDQPTQLTPSSLFDDYRTTLPSAFDNRQPAEIEEISDASIAGERALHDFAHSILETAEVEEIASTLVAGAVLETTSETRVQDEVEIEGNNRPPAASVGTVDAETSPTEPASEKDLTPPSYLSYYGLNEQPFGVTPDPAYLYPSPMHQEAITSLLQGIANLRGFMALVAEPGMGKTTLLNKLMEKLRDSARIIFLFQTQCNSRELFRYLLGELGIASTGMDLVAMHKALNEALFQEMLLGRRFVLIVDEAQNLTDTTLETIRLLSDFETSHAKLLQIVLAGQPQLIDTLMRPGLSQLRQRIAILARLEPLSAPETASYIEHRLRTAGSRGETLFTPDALALIAERSQGTPRRINNICFDALLLGSAEGRKQVDSEIVQRVIAKLELESLVGRPEAENVPTKPTTGTSSDDASQLARSLLAALAGEMRQTCLSGDEQQPIASVKLTGKLSEMIKTWHRGKGGEYRIQVSLGREASSEIPVAERYYCCSFYLNEEEAKGLRAGQPIRIKLEQDSA